MWGNTLPPALGRVPRRQPRHIMALLGTLWQQTLPCCAGTGELTACAVRGFPGFPALLLPRALTGLQTSFVC